ELNRLDYWLRETEAAYKKAGIYERTLWGMAGDHGLAPVYGTLNPERKIFESLQKDLGIKIALEKISSDEGEGPKLTNALNAPSYQKIDVVVASTAGGNFMLDFFNSAAGWATQPIYQELTQWQPKESDKPLDIVSESLVRLGDSLDYLVVREKTCTVDDCAVRVIGMREGLRLDEIIRLVGNKRFYTSQQGQPQLLQLQQLNPYLPKPQANALEELAQLVDKCLYRAEEANIATWCDEQEWRQLTRFTPRPDSVNQLAALYEEDRAGTMNLFPKQGVGYNTKVPGRHAGESYLEKDAFLGFWGKPIGPNAMALQSEQNGSLAPTLYEYLTGESIEAGHDGWGYPSLLNKLDIQ
ncbi:TPA: nucleotide pyrophosphatase, partial [Vibrio cholerae O1]